MSPETPKFTGWWHGAYFKDGMSARIMAQAEVLGGEDIKELEVSEVIGCDKPNHTERSIAHQPNHLKHKHKIH